MTLSLEYFNSMLHSEFSLIINEEIHLPVELIEVKKGDTNLKLGIKPYTLLFRAKLGTPVCAQGFYSIKKDDNSQIQLFFIPRRPDDNGNYYEVIFN